MNLQALETRIQEIDKVIHQLLQEIHQMKEAGADSSPERRDQQVAIARQMRAAREAMAPLGMRVKDLVEEGRGR